MKKLFDKKIFRTLLLWFLFIVTLAVSQGCVSSKEKTPTIKRVAAGEMLVPRTRHDAVLLKDGRVLIIGGNSGRGESGRMPIEVYDPKTKVSKSVKDNPIIIDDKIVDLSGCKGFLLDSGKVLIINKDFLYVFDLETETFTKINVKSPYKNTGGLNIVKIIKLNDGKFFILGGSKYSYIFNSKDNSLKTLEIEPPENPDVAKAKDGKRRLPYKPGLVQLKNGNILLSGGTINTKDEKSWSRIYDEVLEINLETNTVKSVGKLIVSRIGNSSFLLPDGDVLIAGGSIQSESSPIAIERYNTKTNESKIVGYFPKERFSFVLIGNNLLAIGAHKIDVYNIKTNEFYQTNIDTKRHGGQSITVLDNRTILMTGGMGGKTHPGWSTDYLNNIDIFHIK